MHEPTFGSLFAGIGGIDLGLERAGWTGRWQVEYEPFCQRVLAKHWPDIPRYGDIKDVDWSTVEPVDLIAGGFPCQPVSIAGRKLAQADDRWLWPEFARAIRALRPRYVLVENVTNLLGVERGTAFGEVVGDLASLGYDAEWDCIPAAAVGAPHLRDRIWIVATSRALADDAWERAGRSRERTLDGGAVGRGDDVERPNGDAGVADADAIRRNGWTGEPGPGGWRQPVDGCHSLADPDDSGPQGHGRLGYLGIGASQRLARSRRDAVEGQWESEPDVGRVAHGVPARVDRLRALGNAVVPQVVEFIGRRILEAEERELIA